MTNIIHQLGPFSINEAFNMGKGLFNISCAINGEVSLWFDEQEKDWLLSLPENEFIEYACNAVGIEDISDISFSEYQCSDQDAQQYVKTISDSKFHIIEISELENMELDIVEAEIDLDQYNLELKKEILSSFDYYYDGEVFRDQAGDELENQIIAECIFEVRGFV